MPFSTAVGCISQAAAGDQHRALVAEVAPTGERLAKAASENATARPMCLA